jgi:hypothetical protein
MNERGYARLVCDMIEHGYNQVTRLDVQHFRRVERMSERTVKGKMVRKLIVDTGGDRMAATRRALDSAHWFASTACVQFCQWTGFHPSRLWARDEWRSAVARMIVLLDHVEIEGRYDLYKRRLVEECLAHYAKKRRA